MRCGDKGFWRAFLDRETSDAELAAGREHLETCEPCRLLYDRLESGRTFLAAAIKYSGPFCMVIRPRNRTIFSGLFGRG